MDDDTLLVTLSGIWKECRMLTKALEVITLILTLEGQLTMIKYTKGIDWVILLHYSWANVIYLKAK
jgi:hypothetical protein